MLIRFGNIKSQAMVLVGMFIIICISPACKQEKNRPVDVPIVTKYWELRHKIDEIEQTKTTLANAVKEKDTFLLAHTDDPSTWSATIKSEYGKIDDGVKVIGRTYNDLVDQYNKEMETMPEDVTWPNEYEHYIPGNIPKGIPSKIYRFEDGSVPEKLGQYHSLGGGGGF